MLWMALIDVVGNYCEIEILYCSAMVFPRLPANMPGSADQCYRKSTPAGPRLAVVPAAQSMPRTSRVRRSCGALVYVNIAEST
jgi:hypothetical protein